jgi:pimeloyl-ACP methyl ester carboxylesterase
MPTVKRWTWRIGGTLLGLIVVLLVFGVTYEQIGRVRDAKHMPPRIGRAIDVGSRNLNLYCSGEGSPTVVLFAGGNGPGYEWASVQPRMAQFTRACWHDPAGVGWSDPPASPRTSASVINDLQQALRRAGVSPPYVLVGASVGGEYARVYTSAYPGEVAGLVLVDSSHPDQQEPTFMQSPFNLMSSGRRHLICAALPFMARFGILRLIASRKRPGQDEILTKLMAQPMEVRADAEQTCAATDAGRFVPRIGTGNPELDNAARKAGSLEDRPLIVLTAGKYLAPPGFEAEAEAYHQIWIHQLQASLVQLSSRGRQVIVDASHDMDGAEDAVVLATREMVGEVRSSHPR